MKVGQLLSSTIKCLYVSDSKIDMERTIWNNVVMNRLYATSEFCSTYLVKLMKKKVADDLKNFPDSDSDYDDRICMYRKI